MEKYHYIKAGSGKYQIESFIIRAGSDICVVMGGGEKPHIGAVAIAVPRQSLRNDGSVSATASVICVRGHKDDELAKKAALRLAGSFNATAVVSVGLHIDAAGAADILNLEASFEESLIYIIEYLKNN